MSRPRSRLLGRLRQLRTQPRAGLEQLAHGWIQLPHRLRGQHRQRLYPLRQVFWIFLGQILATDKSCGCAVHGWLATLARLARPLPAPGTAAYCRARARLALRDLYGIFRALSRKLCVLEGPHTLWYGRRVRVVDGSGLSMPDTTANQALWPQPHTQKAGCGFPLMRLVVLFSLSSGAALGWAHGSLQRDERALWRRLWKFLAPGDVVLADRGFCDLASWCLLAQRGVDCVMRLHQRRSSGVRSKRRLGRHDWLVAWVKTKVRPQWLSLRQWEALPHQLLVRHIQFSIPIAGWRTRRIAVATTLLDHQAFPAHALAQLYLRRWRCELFLRDIKSTLGMDVLRCKTPDMIHKELLMFLLAYNLLRALIHQAAARAGTAWERLSFKAATTALAAFAARGQACRPQPQRTAMLWLALLECIARSKLPLRPHRAEPRARKRRPKTYALLTQHRQHFREIPHRNRYSIA